MQSKQIPILPFKSRKSNAWKKTCTSAIVSVILGVGAQASSALGQEKLPPEVEKLSDENKELRKRLDAMENILQKEGLAPSCDTTGAAAGAAGTPVVKALSDITLSGFVQASYFYNFAKPADGLSDGYLWNTKDNSFSINKVNVVMASGPLATDKWDAGFKVNLMWGEDAPALNTGSPRAGFEALREAYVELNAPVGTGLNIKVGELISLLNYESGNGGAANVNFSQGYQWWYTGNPPAAGVRVGYAFTEKVDLKVQIQNGMFAGPTDSNDGKAVIASLGLKPTDKAWMNLIGWFSEEADTQNVTGASVIGGYQFTSKFGTGWEFDYFYFANEMAPNFDIVSAGLWLFYDFTPKFQTAFRGDFVRRSAGLLGPAVRPGAGLSTSALDAADGGNIASFTLTATWKPMPMIRVQPELRYDTTSYPGAYDGKEGRFTLGAGVSYLF